MGLMVCALALVPGLSSAQFTSGQILTAAQLNNALAAKTNNTSAAITGGTITGLSVPIPIASGGTGATSSTGTGSLVLSNSPALVTPALGTPSAAVLTNATGLPIAGLTGLGTGVATALGNAATGSGSPVLATSPSIASPTITGAFTATGLVTLADHSTQAANTIIGNGTGSAASPTALSVPSCSTASSALQWTSASGFACNTSMNAATLGSATFAAPGPIGSTTSSTGAFTTIAASGALTQPSTGKFYQNLGANVNRVNDRMFVGAATVNDGTSTGTQDYISANIPQGPTTSISQAAILSGIGEIGLITGSRCSDAASAGTEGCLGHMSAVVNDATGANQQIGQAAYFEAQQKTGAGFTAGIEIDPVNQSGVVNQMNPYNMVSGAAYNVGAWIAAGGARSGVSNSSSAISIVNNGALFDKGIVIQSGALASNEAIALPSLGTIQWFGSASQTTGAIASTQITGQSGIVLTDTGVAIGNVPSGQAASLLALQTSGAVNYITTTPAVTGSGPIVAAGGSDTNVGLSLSGKGTGAVTLQGNSGTTGNFVAAGALTAGNGSANNVGITGATTGNSPTIAATGSDTNVALTLAGKGASGVAVQGTTSGAGAAAGYVGQLLANSASGVSLTNGSAANLTTVPLTPGNWDLQCNAQFVPAGTTTVTSIAASVGTASGSLGAVGQIAYLQASLTTGAQQYLVTPTLRVNVSAGTTAYCVGFSSFGVSTMTGSGYIRATRVN